MQRINSGIFATFLNIIEKRQVFNNIETLWHLQKNVVEALIWEIGDIYK